MDKLYLLDTSIDHVALFIMTFSIAFFLMTAKQKEKSTWMFILFLLTYALFSIRCALHFILVSKTLLVATEIGMLFLYISLFFLIPFSLYYYRELNKRASRIIIFISLIIIAAFTVITIFMAIERPLAVFQFSTDQFFFKNAGPLVGIPATLLLLIPTIIFIIKTIKFSESDEGTINKILFPKGRYSKASRNFAITCLALLLPGILGVIAFLNIDYYSLTRRAMILATLLIIFSLTILYINNSPQPSTFMIKIVSTSLLTILFILTNIITSVIQWERKEYDELRLTEIKKIETLVNTARKQGLSLSTLLRTNKAVIVPPKIKYIARRQAINGNFKNNYKMLYTNNCKISGKKLSQSDRVSNGDTKEIKTHMRMGRLWDHLDLSKSCIYYNFITTAAGPDPGSLYEVGYDYFDYRKKLHVPSINTLIGLLALSFAIVVIFPLFFRGSLTTPLKNLIDGVRKVNDGNLDVKVPVKVQDEFGYLTATFNNMVVSIDRANQHIKHYAENLENMVEDRTAELQSALDMLEDTNKDLMDTRDALWGEMEIATKIQTILLPEHPRIKGYDISAKMIPAADVGGDYYDVINARTSDWLVIGDVSGHGVPAGLIMMMVQTSIQSTLEQNPDINPLELVSLVNRTIFKNITRLKEDKYMTIAAFHVSGDGTLTYSGLHQDIYIYRASTEKIETIRTDGIWIGLIDDIKDRLTEDTLKLETDDAILLYTDGTIEAWEKGSKRDDRIPVKHMFGRERLVEVFKKTGHLKAYDIRSAILHALNDYEFHDDVTLLVVKRVS